MDNEQRKRIWQRFMEDGTLDPRLPPLVARSWQECRCRGVDPWRRSSTTADPGKWQQILQRSRLLLQTAGPIMQSVHEIIRDSHFLLALTDEEGYVLSTIGDDAILARSENILFRRGSVWSNDQVGTNAPGIALEYNQPVQLIGAEHYCADQHGWTCSAAPIHGVDGAVIGSLDLSGSAGAAHPHTLALVVACAFSIERTLISYHQSHFMRAAANGIRESILLLNDKLELRWANATAQRELGLSQARLAGLDFHQVMPQVDWDMTDDAHRHAPLYIDDLRVVLPGNVRRFSATISKTADATGRTYTVILRRQEHLFRSVNRVSGNQAAYTFGDIYAADPLMKQVIDRARQYARYDGSVLIEGESGTGKELFAQAIHSGSSRADGPFVAVNCASLPRDLMESELFGYEKGAFTGALREGNPGKFELADHGTLFLDEIGEMPIEFQAKLLRAVETLRIRRIGGKEEKKLDVRVIAATNRHLEQEVGRGAFRGDLYYRLNVLRLDIPPLRQRPGDIACCTDRFLARFNKRYPSRQRHLAPDAMPALLAYDWPGNVRELQNALERAFYTSSGPAITASDFHLPSSQHDALSPSSPLSPEAPAEAASYERAECLHYLEEARGCVEQAASAMGVSRATFYRLCRHYGIVPKQIRRQFH